MWISPEIRYGSIIYNTLGKNQQKGIRRAVFFDTPVFADIVQKYKKKAP
jgi:hypothetical protein